MLNVLKYLSILIIVYIKLYENYYVIFIIFDKKNFVEVLLTRLEEI